METEGMEVLPLHSVPHLTEQCCFLLNLEWKRSEVARLRSLEASCDKLPTCLVLIRSAHDIKEVIGHSKLTRIPSVPEGCFIESVVIHPNFRRKGLGRYLMEETEKYAASRGFSMVYLSTHGQQIFYGKIGYGECQPISIYGAGLPVNESKSKGTFFLETEAADVFEYLQDGGALKRCETHNNSAVICLPKVLHCTVPVPPGQPPPPPPPLPIFRQDTGLKKVFMNKKL